MWVAEATSIPRIYAFFAVLFYGIYTIAGLQLMFFSYFNAPWKKRFDLISFSCNVSCLALANTFHCMSLYGTIRGIISITGMACLVIYLEELGLTTGVVFGPYVFTDSFGFRITPNLPALVPIMWIGLAYPAILFAGTILTKRLRRKLTDHEFIIQLCKKCIFVALILTSFDIFCEPISVTYGHKV